MQGLCVSISIYFSRSTHRCVGLSACTAGLFAIPTAELPSQLVYRIRE